MGLLFGDVKYLKGGKTALIWGVSPQIRSDRRKDRVETNPEQLSAAIAEADRMTLTTGNKTRVIGWYHSHPGHTVIPSNVDVTTQGSFQALDTGFTGLIFSCFSEFAHKVGRIEVIAFQSMKETQMRSAPVNNTQVVEIDSSLSSSDNVLATSVCEVTENFEHDTGDSRATKGKQKMQELSIVPSNADSLQDATLDIDSMDTSECMQEALHRSTMDMGGGIWVRKVVPLQVLPTKDLLKLDFPLDSLLDMQNMLLEEERLAFKNAIAKNSCDGKIDPITYIHHASTYHTSLCNMMEYCLSPAINALQDNLKENQVRLVKLAEEGKALELEVKRKEMKSLSVHRQPSRVIRSGNQVGVHGLTDSVRSPRRHNL